MQGQGRGFNNSCWFWGLGWGFFEYFLVFLIMFQTLSDIIMTILLSVYNILLENDSNSEVRRAVLSCIAPSARTLPKIVGRTMDVKEAVRKLAYEVNWIT